MSEVCLIFVRVISWITLVPGETTIASFYIGYCFVCQSVCLTVCLRLQCVRLTVCLSRKSKGFFRRVHFAFASVYPLENFGNLRVGEMRVEGVSYLTSGRGRPEGRLAFLPHRRRAQSPPCYDG